MFSVSISAADITFSEKLQAEGSGLVILNLTRPLEIWPPSKRPPLTKWPSPFWTPKRRTLLKWTAPLPTTKKGHPFFVLHYFEQHKLLMGFKINKSGWCGLSLLRQVSASEKCCRMHFISLVTLFSSSTKNVVCLFRSRLLIWRVRWIGLQNDWPKKQSWVCVSGRGFTKLRHNIQRLFQTVFKHERSFIGSSA